MRPRPAHAGPVMIVGATSDMARALARAYAMAGHPIILVARRVASLARDAEDLRLRHGVQVDTLQLDLLDLGAHAAFLDRFENDPEIVIPEIVIPEIVIMVAGLLGEQARATVDAEHAELVMRTNYLAPALFLGHVANRMQRRGRGTIIGISSVAGERGRASNYVYGSAKAGFTAFLSGLRHRMATHGVRVVTVKPGFVRTRMTEGLTLPAALTADPAEVASRVRAASSRQRDVIYVRPIWQPIMAAIRMLPEPVFKKLKL